jgi:hypothetical protein
MRGHRQLFHRSVDLEGYSCSENTQGFNSNPSSRFRGCLKKSGCAKCGASLSRSIVNMLSLARTLSANITSPYVLDLSAKYELHIPIPTFSIRRILLLKRIHILRRTKCLGLISIASYYAISSNPSKFNLT